MRIIIDRFDFTDNATIGALTCGDFHCFTLEDTDRHLEDNPDGKIYGKTAIPRGTYKVIITFSNRFKKELPLLLNVPGFEGVRIHPGNYAGNETFYKTIALNTQKAVLSTEEYVEVFDDG
jgi:hypothetical protein